MKWLGLAVLVMSAISLAGCATTKKDMASEELETRIAELEKQIEEKTLEVDELKSQISEFDAQIKKTELRPAEIPETPKPAAVLSSTEKDLIRVSVSPKDVQTTLKNAGYYTGSIDGKIGDRTKKAIIAFQEANGLTADGVIGQKTWTKLKSYLY